MDFDYMLVLCVYLLFYVEMLGIVGIDLLKIVDMLVYLYVECDEFVVVSDLWMFVYDVMIVVLWCFFVL